MNNKNIISESLDYHDMVKQVEPIVTVDEYSAKMGKDSDIVTLSFKVNSEAAGDDLVNWFERGYEWVLDASISEGEIEVGKYLVFVEFKRRSTTPERILTLISDLKTLTDLDVADWKIEVDGKKVKPDEKSLKEAIICNPSEYKIGKEKEEELNEMRLRAGLNYKPVHLENMDSDLKDFLSSAGL